MAPIINRFKRMLSLLGLIFLSVFIFSQPAIAAEETTATTNAKSESPKHFAIVDGEKIMLTEFQAAYQAGIRQRFYHGKIPPEQMEAFKREVSQTLIDRVLLSKEAKRRNIAPDMQFVEQQLAAYEKRYADKDFWKNHKQNMIEGLRVSLMEESRLQQLEKRIKEVPLPSDVATEAFYEKNQALFTTPEKFRVSLILLKVEPSSPANVWEAAQKEAQDIVERLKQGAEFSELARIHSGDASAVNGGDMGFIHKGMLSAPAQNALDLLQENQISDPVMLLQGIAILKLRERKKPVLNSFASVKERARQLLHREQSKNAWSDLLELLRDKAIIDINTAALTSDNKV